MRTNTFFLAAIGLVMVAGQAMAQGIQTERIASASGATRGATVPYAEAVRLEALTVSADSLFAHGQLEIARRLLKEVVRSQEKVGVNPAATLRRLANIELAMDNTYAAATTLEDAAIAAERFDDPTTRLVALVDAMLLYVDLGRRDRQAELVKLIVPLLKSPAIPEATRLSVKRLLHL